MPNVAAYQEISYALPHNHQQTFDLYCPAPCSKPCPLVIFVHGGTPHFTFALLTLKIAFLLHFIPTLLSPFYPFQVQETNGIKALGGPATSRNWNCRHGTGRVTIIHWQFVFQIIDYQVLQIYHRGRKRRLSSTILSILKTLPRSLVG